MLTEQELLQVLDNGPKTTSELAQDLGFGRGDVYTVRLVLSKLTARGTVQVLDGSPERYTLPRSDCVHRQERAARAG